MNKENLCAGNRFEPVEEKKSLRVEEEREKGKRSQERVWLSGVENRLRRSGAAVCGD